MWERGGGVAMMEGGGESHPAGPGLARLFTVLGDCDLRDLGDHLTGREGEGERGG